MRILLLTCLVVCCATAQYVYEKPLKGADTTVNEDYGHVMDWYAQQQQLVNEEVNKAVQSPKPLGGNRNACDATKCFCGLPNVNRIVGGTIVKQNKYPWTAQLVKGRYYPRLFCGGSLINDRYVLTAAHCVDKNRDQITVRLLQLDRSSNNPGIVRKVVQTIMHPQYDNTRIINDVALLKLESPIPINNMIRPVCLPDANHNFDGKSAVVAGWGLVKENGVTSNNLQEAVVPIISNAQCRQTRYKNKIVDQMLCAGLVQQGGKDACQGDSGGPLIVSEGRFKLAGVVSFGYGCAQKNAPGVYARVSKYIDWIQTNTKDACYCSS